jgi:hypothetical protein
VTDRVDRDGESVVLVGQTVVRLSAMATLLLDGCEDWIDVGVLAEHLVAELGPPPDGAEPRRVVESAVDSLVARGLLERARPLSTSASLLPK